MHILKKISFLILFGFLLTGCEKKEDEFPEVKTLNAEIPDDGGVILYGQLKGGASIDQYGFYYSRDTLFRDFQTVTFDGPINSGTFHAEINTELRPGEVYFYKAYIITNQTIMFGSTNVFLSTGSKSPEILQVIPEIAHISDTVKIYGKYFGKQLYYNYTRVIFCNANARIVQLSDSLITCIIPPGFMPYKPQIKVTSFNKSDSASFQLYKPLIESISPARAFFRDTVTLIGQHFDLVENGNKVILGSTVADVISYSRNKLEFVIPDDLDKSVGRINLTAQLQSTLSESSFNLILPEITNIPECTFSYSEIELKGRYFHPVTYRNQVIIEGIEAEVLSGNSGSLTIVVPMGPFPRGYADVKIKVADTTVSSDMEFCIEDNWLMISNSLPFTFYGDVGTFTIGNTAYVISQPLDYDEKQYLWEFNEDDYSWVKYAIPFELMHTGICTSLEDKGYVYTATETNNLWEFDPTNHTWTQKADFPGVRRDEAAIFSVNQNIFVGLGSDFYLSNLTLHDFYKFDPSLNTWSRISDLNPDEYSARTEASTFVIGNIAYLTCGARNTGMYDAWKYISSTDQWIRIADFPDARSYTSSFVLNGKGYIANGTSVGSWQTKDCWEYNPATNVWKPFYDIGHKRRYRGFAFSVNGKAFVGGGYGGANTGKTTWELYLLNKL